jgi:hypothetical protein
MMIGQQKAARGEADALCLHQRLRDQEIGGGVRLPNCGVVLTDPGLLEPELVGPAQRLQIPAVTLSERTLRRVRRHREQAVAHGVASLGFPLF